MMQGFMEVFSSHTTIPVGILIDPLLRTMNGEENNQKYNFNIFDFEFLAHIAKHPKL